MDNIRLLFAYTGRHVPLRSSEPSGLHDVLLPGRWQVQFCEADLKTPLPRTFTFTDLEKIRELARRGEARAVG